MGLEYGFSLTRIFPYWDIIIDSVLIREYTDQRKSIFWHILGSGNITLVEKITKMIDVAKNKYNAKVSYNLL